MNIGEVSKWRDFIDEHGVIWDLSFLNAHSVQYTHNEKGKDPITYLFYVSYSFHCFTKDYPSQTEQEKSSLMYHAPKASRPFCKYRYKLAKNFLKDFVLSLDERKVFHAKGSSYSIIDIIDCNGDEITYFIPFRVFREDKKFRIHVTSAFAEDIPTPGRKKVGFFKIAHNLHRNKPLPKPQK